MYNYIVMEFGQLLSYVVHMFKFIVLVIKINYWYHVLS